MTHFCTQSQNFPVPKQRIPLKGWEKLWGEALRSHPANSTPCSSTFMGSLHTEKQIHCHAKGSTLQETHSMGQVRIGEQRTSLVVQWLRICLAMQGMQIQSLLGELRPHMQRGSQTQLLSPRGKTKTHCNQIN